MIVENRALYMDIFERHYVGSMSIVTDNNNTAHHFF